MLFETLRSPLVADVRVLRPLVWFGFLHGTHEWLEMFLARSDWLTFQHPVGVAWARILMLASSFLALLVFGLLMLRPLVSLRPHLLAVRNPPEWARRARWWVLAIYVALVFAVGVLFHVTPATRLNHLDAIVRYGLAIPAAGLAGLALWRQAGLSRTRGLATMERSLKGAGICFLLYACTQAVSPPLDHFPGNWLNTVVFMNRLGIPVQLVRAVLAVFVTIHLVLIIQASEAERQRRFQCVEQERLAALEQVQAQLLERENMRREFMHAMVLTQEQERARIARELHDETAQVLTAFSLHLATLRSDSSTALHSRIDVLQELCKQMSSDLHRLVHDLRPAQLDDLGLPAALSDLARESEKQFGLQVELQIHGVRQRLAPLVETVLFRIAQEGLTNVARHAGVKHAIVQLDFSTAQVRLCVQDHGCGFDPQARQPVKYASRLGLVGMQERAESVHGRLHVTSAPGAGVCLEVLVPLDQDALGDSLAEQMAAQEVIKNG